MELMAQRELVTDLIQLDVDAVAVYDAALPRVTHDEVYRRLAGFREDHVRHIQALNVLLIELGGQHMDGKPDFKGKVLERFAAVSSWMGTEGALIAMIGNEELTNRRYEAILQAGFSAAARKILQRNAGDERNHLRWMKRLLRELTLGVAERANPP